MSNNPIAMFDITIPEVDYEVPKLLALMKLNCSRFAFQLEEGTETGYRHYQCRISLKKKMRFSTMLNKKLFSGHISATSNPTHFAGDEFYVLKDETRIDGPWTDRDVVKTVTKQLTIFQGYTLRKYQEAIIEECNKFCMRTINLIYDPVGNCGKSLLSEYLEFEGMAEEVPPYRLMDDIFQWVATRPIKGCYIVDMPRGMKKDKLADFYSGIEVIKNGVAYDKRYTAKKVRFSRPRIFIFTNELPCFDLMSKDRWITWQILPDYSYKIMEHTAECDSD